MRWVAPTARPRHRAAPPAHARAEVGRQLIERLNALLVLGWRQKIQSRAKIRLAIEDTLDEGLPRAYTKELFAKKTDVLFEHVYEAYQGDGASVFEAST